MPFVIHFTWNPMMCNHLWHTSRDTCRGKPGSKVLYVNPLAEATRSHIGWTLLEGIFSNIILGQSLRDVHHGKQCAYALLSTVILKKLILQFWMVFKHFVQVLSNYFICWNNEHLEFFTKHKCINSFFSLFSEDTHSPTNSLNNADGSLARASSKSKSESDSLLELSASIAEWIVIESI